MLNACLPALIPAEKEILASESCQIIRLARLHYSTSQNFSETLASGCFKVCKGAVHAGAYCSAFLYPAWGEISPDHLKLSKPKLRTVTCITTCTRLQSLMSTAAAVTAHAFAHVHDAPCPLRLTISSHFHTFRMGSHALSHFLQSSLFYAVCSLHCISTLRW